MPVRFTVLASGSSGNASLLQCNGFGVLVDAGLGPRRLAERLDAVGLCWQSVHAVLLTHTHSDHWKETTLAHLLRRRLPLRCHGHHARALQEYSKGFLALRDGGLIAHYESRRPFELAPGLMCRPFPLSHDSGALKLLQRVRDESHRLANTYNAQLRLRKISESLLDEFPQIGERRKAALLKKFGSVQRMRLATVEQLAEVPGFGGKAAAELKAFLEARTT